MLFLGGLSITNNGLVHTKLTDTEVQILGFGIEIHVLRNGSGGRIVYARDSGGTGEITL